MLANVYSRLVSGGSFTAAVATLAGGTLLAQIITALSMPIVTRVYSPREIGVISVFIAFFGFWSMILSWRYDSALLVTKDDNETRAVLKFGMNIAYLMSACSGVIIYGLVRQHILGFGLLPWWVGLAAPPIFLGYGFYMLYRGYALRYGFVKRISHATISRSLSNAATRVILGVAGGGVVGLFAAEFAGSWGATAVIRAVCIRHQRGGSPNIPAGLILKVAKRYRAFAKYEMPSVLLDQLALTIPVPIIASMYGAEAAGWFGFARILAALPNAQVGRAIADVFQMQLSHNIRDGRLDRAKQLFYKLFQKLSIFGLFPLALISIAGPLLAPWVFGRSWAMMGIIAAYIAPWMYAALIVGSLSRLLSVLERQKYKFIYDIVALAFVVLEYYFANQYGLGLTAFIVVLSALNIVAYGIYLLVLVWVVRTDLSETQAT